MAIELPALPYAYDALGPYMSKETLEFHHDKHHMAYVTNGNNLLKESPLASKSIEEICKVAYADKIAGLEAVEEAVGRATEMGKPVLYVPGNHDEFARDYAGHSFGGVEVLLEALRL